MAEASGSNSEGQPAPPPGGSVDALAHRLSVAPEIANRVVYFAVLAAVSLGAALLASPGLSGQKVPELGQEDLGRVFRGSSPSGFKASRDYEVLDEAGTTRQREEARSHVRPVFDYDPSVQSAVSRGIQDAFAEMQTVVSDFHAASAPKKPEEGAPAPAPQPKKKAEPQPPARDLEAELTAQLREARKKFEALAPLADDEDFEVLVQNRFSREAAKATVELIEVAYRSKLATSRDELSRVDASGITVRILGGSSEHQMGTAAPSVLDLREAGQELDRYASVPGNLLPEANQTMRRAVLRLAKRQLRANLTVNIAETETRRKAAYEAVKPVVISLKKGQKVIGDGELITERHLLIVNSMRSQTDELDLMQIQVGGAGVVGIVVLAAWVFLGAAFRRFRPGRKDTVFLGLLMLGLLGAMDLWMSIADAVHDRYGNLPIEALTFCFPFAAGAMLVRFVMNEELALFFGLVFACITGVLLGSSLSYAVFALVTALVASERISKARDRAGIFRAGLVTGGVGCAVALCLGLAEGRQGPEIVWAVVFAFVGAAFLVPMVVMALTSLSEALFGYASDIKLLELANLNHPALKELVLQAPGTYHHSIIMGSLVEAAAEAIGANPLLARSCAYYHDIGKGKNPVYFGENQKGDNRHDTLAPAMSAVIIKRHVTDGLEMARQYKLPQRVADAIPQHHGTRLVGFFFHKAQKEQEGKENPQPIDESIYRYPGPRPQFREAALLMIADAVEAASRSMTEPTTAKLQALVQKLINLIFSEGQLDDCDLTLKDLNLIAQSFVRTLEGIYHARPAYPAAAVGGGKAPASEPVKAMGALALAPASAGKPETAQRKANG